MVNSDLCHELLVESIKQELAYRGQADFEGWKETLRQKFLELTGLVEIEKNACPMQVCIEWEKDEGSYRLIRFTFESEKGEIVPCYLLVPKTGKEKYPVAITLQGHTTGFHNSIGEIKYEGDRVDYPNDAYALQAVENGYIALAIEQRGMGERKARRQDREPSVNCRHASMVALLLGRTLLGERIWDVHKAIDALETFPECDLDKIFITGHSGGGTMSFYAACYDSRIKFSVPSCSFSPYKTSILDIAHCNCNYLPSAYRYFEMQDLSALLAPRGLIVVAGEKDEIFPVGGVKQGFERARAIYERCQCEENCRLVVTPKAHYWCKDVVWEHINEKVKRLGW